jgi:hypothetical protein
MTEMIEVVPDRIDQQELALQLGNSVCVRCDYMQGCHRDL